MTKFAACVIDNRGKFATGVADTGGKFAAGVIDTGDKFATVVVDTSGAPSLVNISTNWKKIWNDLTVIFGGLGEDDSWKNPEAKNLVTLSL